MCAPPTAEILRTLIGGYRWESYLFTLTLLYFLASGQAVVTGGVVPSPPRFLP